MSTFVETMLEHIIQKRQKLVELLLFSCNYLLILKKIGNRMKRVKSELFIYRNLRTDHLHLFAWSRAFVLVKTRIHLFLYILPFTSSFSIVLHPSFNCFQPCCHLPPPSRSHAPQHTEIMSNNEGKRNPNDVVVVWAPGKRQCSFSSFS